MTISFTNLFTRLGHEGGTLNSLNTWRGTTLPGRVTTLESDYETLTPVLSNVLDGIYQQLTAAQGGLGGFAAQIAARSAQLIIQTLNLDSALASLDTTTAMIALIAQMNANAQTVNRPTVSVGTITAGGTNSGDAQVVASIKNPSGVQMDYVFLETLTVTCTTDSQTSAIAGKEPLSVIGITAQANELNFDWPLGSGTNSILNAISANDQQSTATNLLNNGNFESWTGPANTPDNWPILVGTAGTTIFKSSSGNAYAGSAALQFTGNGAELTSIAQPFNVSSNGTSAKLKPLTVYALNCWLKVDVVPAAGVLALDLVDGSNTTINDAAGTANTVSQSLPSATTSYKPLNAVFRTPAILPATQKLRIRLSTALSNTRNVFVDHVALTPMRSQSVPGGLYAGGPYLSVFSGASNLIAGDNFSVPINNNFGGAFQKLFERLFQMRTLGLMLPSSGAPSISDGLVT